MPLKVTASETLVDAAPTVEPKLVVLPESLVRVFTPLTAPVKVVAPPPLAVRLNPPPATVEPAPNALACVREGFLVFSLSRG